MPTLFIVGDTDAVITRPMSDELIELYNDNTVIRHTGGHYIPTLTPYKDTVAAFFDRFK